MSFAQSTYVHCDAKLISWKYLPIVNQTRCDYIFRKTNPGHGTNSPFKFQLTYTTP